jgi:thiamine-phosphate pyrophosphorylase
MLPKRSIVNRRMCWYNFKRKKATLIKRKTRFRARKIIDWRLCFIADSGATEGRDILSLVKRAVDGGATLIQLRGKIWSTREFLEFGIKIRKMLEVKNVPLIINDKVDIALACGAAGVHLGQEDLPLRLARKILGNKRIIGISVNTPDEAEAAENEGADYLGAGPVFPTSSKNNLGPLLGLEGIRRIRAKVKIPILAIGGIKASNAAKVISAGVDGVAVISAIAASPSPNKAATEIIESIGKVKIRSGASEN